MERPRIVRVALVDRPPMPSTMAGRSRRRDVRRRVEVAVAISALLVQSALPLLHVRAVRRTAETAAAPATAREGTLPRFTAKTPHAPLHDASDCLVCRSL